MSDARLLRKIKHILSYEDEREPDELENTARYIVAHVRASDKRRKKRKADGRQRTKRRSS